MQKTCCLSLFLFILCSMHYFIPCQAGASVGPQKIVNYIDDATKTKDSILDIIKEIKDPQRIKTLLTDDLKADDPKSSRFKRFGSHYKLIEYILLNLSADSPALQLNQRSHEDLLEISKHLWNLDPEVAASVKGVKELAAGELNGEIAYAPLIHKLVYQYITLSKYENPDDVTKKRREIFKNFIDFIIKDHPQTLSVKNNLQNTALCMLYNSNIEWTPLTKDLIQRLIATRGSSEDLILLIIKTGATKEMILDVIKGIKSDQVKKAILTDDLETEKKKDSKYKLIEYILLRLPGLLKTFNPSLSRNDLLEISKALWNLDPTTAASVKGITEGRETSDTDYPHKNNAPLIHKLICEYINLSASKNPDDSTKEQTKLLSDFIDFIIKDHPQTLSVTNNLQNTALHMLRNPIFQDAPLTKDLTQRLTPTDTSITSSKKSTDSVAGTQNGTTNYAPWLMGTLIVTTLLGSILWVTGKLKRAPQEPETSGNAGKIPSN